MQEAALRELKEETGYVGKVVGVSGRQYLSPGLTNENIVTVYVEVGEGHTAGNRRDGQPAIQNFWCCCD
jgi:8-oxo-dGTP pyrophosphatase MutT (NUDIX family)